MKLNELMKKYGEYEVKEGFMDLLEKPKPKSVWDLEGGDTYYYIDEYGDISDGRIGDDYEDEIFAIGNVFLTKEDAEFEVKRLKVVAELKKYAKEFSYEEWRSANTQKYYLCYNWTNDEVNTDYNYFSSYGSQLLFESGEKAQEAIDAVGEDRIKKYYFGVRE